MIAPFAEVVACRSRAWPFAARKWVVLGMILGVDAAIVTHLDHAELFGIGKHGVAFQLRGNPFDGRLHAE